ncbi:MAG: TonB-dependent receptor [Chitinophagaceae bacterium]
MFRIIKRSGLLLLLALLVQMQQTVHAQARFEVSGMVIATDNNEPLAGVTVGIKGGSTATTTDKDGKFKISGKDGKFTLLFSFSGFVNKEIAVNNKTVINTKMDTDTKSLDDVVVIGYQTVKRKDLLASVSSVGAKELKDIPINSAAEALNGRLAGVTATTAEGSPDAEVRVRVRGGMSISQDNSPLYIVDGVQVESGLSTISPQDIQSIDVLKDAAATAIYGARGANGVIVITTKTGKPGKLKLAYNGFFGFKNLAKELDVLSPYDFIVYQYERSRGSNADSTSFSKNYGSTWDTLANYKNVPAVDWQNEVMGRTGFTQSHNVSATGGSKSTTYNFNFTHNDDKAILLNSQYQRSLLNLKAEHKITKDIKLSVGGRYTNQVVYGAGTSDDKGTSFNRLRNAVKYRPFLSAGQEVDDSDPFADPNAGNGLSLTNPIQLANSEYRKKFTEAYNITGSLTYNITKKLTFKSTFGYDNNHLTDKQFSDSITPYATTQGDKKPIISLDTTNKKTLTNSNVLTYSLKGLKGGHDFDFLVGEETYQLETETRGRTIKGFDLNTSPNKAFAENGNHTIVGVPRLYRSKYTSLSFFGRINYALKDKYLFSVNMRADGASKFAAENKWGYFPAGSFAWRVSKENFLKDVKFISDVKLRASIGTVGNNRIDDYLFLTTFRNDQYYYGLNGQLVQGYNSTSLVNEKLKWEQSISRNLGLDISLFRNRIDLSVDYYNNDSKDLLLNVPVASTYGYATQLQNIGKTNNKGLELQLNATLIRKPKSNFNWTANFNIAFGKTSIRALGVNQQYFYPSASWGVSGQIADYIVKVGQPVGSIYGLVTDGFYTVNDFDYNAATRVYTLKAGVVTDTKIVGAPQPGTIRFKDLNGDGSVDIDNDRQIIGNPTPDFTGGLNQQFTYKQWDASIFVNFSYGNDIYNANKIELSNAYTNNANLLGIMRNRWRTVNEQGQTVTDPTQLAALNANATIWKPIVGAGAFVTQSWAIEDGSFLRFNNVTLGYTLPVKALAKLHLSKLRFYATANNLGVLTSYSGYDPEVSVRRNPLTPGLDYSAYPKSRSYIFGVNVIF